MASKTHIRRVRRARKGIETAMRAEGLDPAKHDDHMTFLKRLHERVTKKPQSSPER